MTWPQPPERDDKERRQLIARLEREGLEFERWLITLATGTLVLSVTLLGRFSTPPDRRTLVIAAWIALVVSICAGLLDRLIYIFSISKHPLLADGEDREKNEDAWLQYWAWSERMSWVQIVAFFLGIVLLLAFAVITLSS